MPGRKLLFRDWRVRRWAQSLTDRQARIVGYRVGGATITLGEPVRGILDRFIRADLDDWRVLWGDLEVERSHAVWRSIETQRDNLRNLMRELPGDSEVIDHVAALRNAIHAYLTAHSDPSYEDDRTLHTSEIRDLHKLRLAFLEVLLTLQETYGVPAAARLATKIPVSDPAVSDTKGPRRPPIGPRTPSHAPVAQSEMRDRAPPPGHQNRRRMMAAALILALLAITTIAFLILRRSDTTEIRRATVAFSAKTIGAQKPEAITATGATLWVASSTDETVIALDGETGHARTSQPISIDQPPYVAAIGGIGFQLRGYGLASAGRSVWVVSSNGTLTRVDARTFHITLRVALPPAPGGHTDKKLNAGPIAVQGNSVWVGAKTDPGIVRLDASSGKRIDVFRPHGAGGYEDFTVGLDALWALDRTAKRLYRLQSTSSLGAVQEGYVPIGAGATTVAAGLGGVWIGYEDGRLTRVDPSTGVITLTIRLRGEVKDIAISAGAVWVARGAGDVTRVSRSGRVLESVRVSGGVRAMAGAPNGVGVVDRDRSQVTRIKG